MESCKCAISSRYWLLLEVGRAEFAKRPLQQIAVIPGKLTKSAIDLIEQIRVLQQETQAIWFCCPVRLPSSKRQWPRALGRLGRIAGIERRRFVFVVPILRRHIERRVNERLRLSWRALRGLAPLRPSQ